MRRVTAAFLWVSSGFALGIALTAWERGGSIRVTAKPESSSRVQTLSEPATSPPAEDPGGRMMRLLKEPASLARDAALLKALARMSKEDFAAYAKELQEEIRRFRIDSRLAPTILDAWFQKDGLAAREAAKQAMADPANRHSGSLSCLLGAAAARHDPKWAVDNLLIDPGSEPPGWTSNAAIMEEVTKKDRKLAEAVMRQFEDSGRRQSLLAGYVRGLAESDPLAAMDVAVSEKAFQRVNLIPTALRAAARSGVNMARLALSKIEDPAQRRKYAWEATRIIATESVADPFAFLREEAGLDDPAQKMNFSDSTMGGALHRLTKRDPVETVNWTMSLPQEKQQVLLGKVLSIWGASDPEGMLKWAHEQEGSVAPAPGIPGTNASIPQLAASLGKLFSAQALLKKGQTHEALQAAPREINELVSGDMQQLLGDAAVNDPEATAEWVSKLPSDKALDPYVSTVAEYYAKTEPGEAARWIEQLPDGSARDAAVMGLLRSFSLEDPAAATEWVSHISDQAKRDESVAYLWRIWSGQDDSAAREWLTGLTNISERVKRNFLAQ